MKAVFWDFDGTLVYSQSLWSNSMRRVLGDAGYAAELAEIRPFTRTGFTWHTPQSEYPHRLAHWWPDLFSHMHGIYRSLQIPPERFAALDSSFRSRILDPASYVLYPDALDTLSRVRRLGYHCFLLSNNYPELAQVAQQLGLMEYLNGCVVSATVGYEKPNRKLFDVALSLAGHPDET